MRTEQMPRTFFFFFFVVLALPGSKRNREKAHGRKTHYVRKQRQINDYISLTYHSWKEIYREKKLKLIENFQ